MPELLAPAGSRAMLLAALRCGADAVYFGGSDFNARTGAENFSPGQLREAIVLCRTKGVRAYLTLNTMLSDRELPRAVALADQAAQAGIDAFIVQDLGLLKLLCARFPGIALHASTQCSVQTAPGMALLRQLGATRAVVPRECTKEELAALAEHTIVELEVFVHGAHCMAVSGQCTLSAALGERSGNKGSCAQPCRLLWRAGNMPNALSLKDLSLIEEVAKPPLCCVASLKIEGRRKRPEYAAAAVTALRCALDGTLSPVSREELRQAFSRSGFTKGYYNGRRDAAMFGRRDKEDAASPELLARLQQLYTQDRPENPLPEKSALPVIAEQQATACLKLQKHETWLRFLSHEQVPERLPAAATIFLPCDTPPERIQKYKADVVVPAGIFGTGARVLQQLQRAKAAGARQAMAQTLDGAALAREAGLTPVAGEGMNLCNSESLCAVRSLGFASAIVSTECSAAQLRDLRRAVPTGAVVYGRAALMLLRNCPVRAGVGCKACGGKGSLTDRRGVRFPVRCWYDCAVLYNSRPIWLADKTLPALDVRLFSFTVEPKAECAAVLRAYEQGAAGQGAYRPREFTRGWGK